MGITLKADPDKGWATMALFDVDPALMATAMKHGIQCIQTSPGTFVIKSANQVFGTVPVKGTALTLAQQKALGPNSKIAFKTNFEAALKKGIDVSPPVKTSEYVAEAWEDIHAAPEVDSPVVKLSKASPAKSQSSMPPLIDANFLYQKVQGTSSGSVYYVFALFPGLNLAARLKGSKLSVRAEGEKLSTYQSQLVNAFKMDQSPGYVSAHYSVFSEGLPLVIKTLGAIVGTIGFDKAIGVADFEKLVSLGAP